MHRLAAIAFAALFVGGCTSKPAEPPPISASQARYLERSEYAETPGVSALAFDAPAAMGHPGVNLSREPREPGAFVGFDSSTTVFSYVLFDDRQGYDDGGYGNRDNRFRRDAISEEFKTSTR